MGNNRKKKGQKNAKLRKLHKLRHSKKSAVEKNQSSSPRERNIGHQNGEEHSRVRKGNQKTGRRGTGGTPRR